MIKQYKASEIKVDRNQPLAGQILDILYRADGVPYSYYEIRTILGLEWHELDRLRKELKYLVDTGAICTRFMNEEEDNEYEMEVYWSKCDD